jgi:hypothetical protein
MDNVVETAKPQKQIERVTIEDHLKEKLIKLTEQANAVLNGITTVTKSDVANMILAAHADDLNPAEIETLKSTHLDQVKFAFWVANRLKEARATGEKLTMSELLASSQPVLERTRRPRKKKDAPSDEGPSAANQPVAE